MIGHQPSGECAYHSTLAKIIVKDDLHNIKTSLQSYTFFYTKVENVYLSMPQSGSTPRTIPGMHTARGGNSLQIYLMNEKEHFSDVVTIFYEVPEHNANSINQWDWIFENYLKCMFQKHFGKQL